MGRLFQKVQTRINIIIWNIYCAVIVCREIIDSVKNAY